MTKLFLYDRESTTADTLRVMNRKGYTCKALTNNADFFWSEVEKLQTSDILVLLSHGDHDGPLAVAGQMGDDVDLVRLGGIVKQKSLKLYLLSCHTGLPPCATTLLSEGVPFVAPMGYAVFQTVGDEVVNVASKENDTFPGWAGPLSPPGRASKMLSLP